MTDRQVRQYQMLLRLKEFGAAYANRFPDDMPARDAFIAIEEALNQLNTFAVRRLAAKRQDVRARALARATLVNMMEAVSRTARLLKAKDPEFPNTFLMPVQESAEAILTTARLFAEQAEPFAERFRAHSMGKAFPENFKRVLQRYEEAIEGRERGKGLTTVARKSIEAAITDGLAAARRLDIIVESVLGSDPVAVGDWARSRRIGYRLGKKPPEDASVTPVTAPEVASPAPAPAAEAGTEVPSGDGGAGGGRRSDAGSATTVPDVAEITVPVDLDVGDLTDVVAELSTDAAPTVAAETEDDEAA